MLHFSFELLNNYNELSSAADYSFQRNFANEFSHSRFKLYKSILAFIKRDIYIISSDLSFKEGQPRFITVPFKPLTDQGFTTVPFKPLTDQGFTMVPFKPLTDQGFTVVFFKPWNNQGFTTVHFKPLTDRIYNGTL